MAQGLIRKEKAQTRYMQCHITVCSYIIMEIILHRKKCQAPLCDSFNVTAYSCMYYDCLGDEEYHYYCDEHARHLKCPVHVDGRRWCEVSTCNNLAKKYTRITYSCLTESDCHFFCNRHYDSVNCYVHPEGYRR